MNPQETTGARQRLRRALILSALAAPLSSWASGAVPTQALQADSFSRLRARHLGSPWVVHLWGETCGPCLAELPQWPALMRSTGLPLVLIQADARTGRAERQMAAQGLDKLERWATPQGLDEFARARIDPTWSGELPRTLLIAADGSTTAISGSVDPEQLQRWALQARRGR
jgi:thiol-disulfide isomerase/thioredoxin